MHHRINVFPTPGFLNIGAHVRFGRDAEVLSPQRSQIGRKRGSLSEEEVRPSLKRKSGFRLADRYRVIAAQRQIRTRLMTTSPKSLIRRTFFQRQSSRMTILGAT